jgi:hypothetical protein
MIYLLYDVKTTYGGPAIVLRQVRPRVDTTNAHSTSTVSPLQIKVVEPETRSRASAGVSGGAAWLISCVGPGGIA